MARKAAKAALQRAAMMAKEFNADLSRPLGA